MRTNIGLPVHRTESTKNSGSPVKLSEYSFSNQQQYNQLFQDWLCFRLWIIGDAGSSPAWGEIQSEPQSAFKGPITLVIITWLADSCRNRMLRHCPTDDHIIGGKKKGEWPLFLWELKLLWCILCSSQSMCDICNSQFCGQQPNYALTPALLQRNTEKLSSLSLQSSYKCLDWAQ